MIDPFVLLTPILVLAVVALLRFVGCRPVEGLPGPPGPYVSPSGVSLGPSGTAEFRFTVDGIDTSAAWTNSGLGTIVPSPGDESTGLYTAPASIPGLEIVTVTARSWAHPTQYAIATVTLNPPIK